MGKFVHQALVRRDVVVKLIEGAKMRGHRAYQHVCMEEVRKKAAELPDGEVPPEIMRLVPLDNALDKIQMQKAATPVPRPDGLHEAAEILEATKGNAVVLEKSSFDDGDINAQRVEALRSFVQRVSPECEHDGTSERTDDSDSEPESEGPRGKRPRGGRGGEEPDVAHVKESEEVRLVTEAHERNEGVDRLRVCTGNTMMDQFEPWYFGVAFAFIFKYCTGMPDMPAFLKRPRHRRSEEAPRVELPLWVRIMSRRVESQLSRDWHF
eukprot:4122876-Pyramimonas_sp.AAC.1